LPRIFLKEGVDYGPAEIRAALAQAPFQITGSSCSLVKITRKSDEQENAEAKVEYFEEKLGPFVVAAETTRMPMVFADAKQAGNPIIFANDSFLSLTGYDRKEVLVQNFNFLMAHGTDADAQARIQTELKMAPIAVWKSFTAARMAASSGPRSSSVQFGIRTLILFSILPRSWISPSIRKS